MCRAPCSTLAPAACRGCPARSGSAWRCICTAAGACRCPGRSPSSWCTASEWRAPLGPPCADVCMGPCAHACMCTRVHPGARQVSGAPRPSIRCTRNVLLCDYNNLRGRSGIACLMGACCPACLCIVHGTMILKQHEGAFAQCLEPLQLISCFYRACRCHSQPLSTAGAGACNTHRFVTHPAPQAHPCAQGPAARGPRVRLRRWPAGGRHCFGAAADV